MRGDGGLDQEGSSRNGNNWLVSEYILKVESEIYEAFDDRLEKNQRWL